MAFSKLINESAFHKRFNLHYYRKNIFMTIITTIIIVIFILSLYMYNYFKEVSLLTTNNYIKDSLSQVSTVATSMNNFGNSLSLQLMHDRDLIPILNKTLPSANHLSVALKRLDNYALMNSQVHSIYVYNGYTDTFYTTLPSQGTPSKDDFFDKDLVHILEHPEKHDTSIPLARTLLNQTNTFHMEETSNVYSFVNYEKSLVDGKEILTAIVVNISEQALQGLIQSMSNNNPDIFIMDHSGTLLTSITSHPMLTDVNTLFDTTPIITSPTTSGYFIQKVDNIPHIVTYVSSSSPSNWYFVQLTPYSTITKDITNLRNSLLFFGFILSLLGICYTFIASKKLSTPLYKLENKLHTFKEQSRQDINELKSHFLNSLIISRHPLSKSYIEEGFIKYKISFDPYSPFRIILLDFKPLTSSSNEFLIKDEQLLVYSAINIAEELGHAQFNCTCIPLTDLKVLCLLNINPALSLEDSHIYLENYLDALLDTYKKFLGMSISSTVSAVGEDLSLLVSLYQEVVGSASYHLIYGDEATIFQELIDDRESKPFTYPQELHQLLFDNLKSGQLNDVISIYHQIIDYTSEHSYTALINTLLHLAYTINMMLSKLNISEGFSTTYNQNAFVNLIKNAEQLSEVNTSFIELFTQICNEINKLGQQKKDKNYNQLVTEVYRLIALGYSNPDTCIQSIADELDMSPAYLGRLFTNLTEQSITYCITEKRLSTACHLLVSSQSPISEIYAICGFSSINYFYKLFKKSYGVTPSTYRQNKTPLETK